MRKRPIGNAVTFNDWLSNIGITIAAEADVWIPDGRRGYVLPVQSPVPLAVMSEVSFASQNIPKICLHARELAGKLAFLLKNSVISMYEISMPG